MFRSTRSFTRLTLTAAVALLAACSAADQIAPKPPVGVRPVGAPSLDVIVNAVAPDSLSADFTVTPSGGIFVLGNNAVYFPDHAICDPETSSYGPGSWDEACVPLDRPIDFHAEVHNDGEGRSWIDFTPSVRFVPSDDPNQTVWMMTKANTDITEENFRGFAMRWMPLGTPDESVDESLTDPSLRTFVDLERDIVFRRVKHFSGYVVAVRADVELDSGSLIDIAAAW